MDDDLREEIAETAHLRFPELAHEARRQVFESGRAVNLLDSAGIGARLLARRNYPKAVLALRPEARSRFRESHRLQCPLEGNRIYEDVLEKKAGVVDVVDVPSADSKQIVVVGLCQAGDRPITKVHVKGREKSPPLWCPGRTKSDW